MGRRRRTPRATPIPAVGPILVTGGTGTLGQLVVARLRAAGREVRVLSRAPHRSTPGLEFVVGDLVTDSGVAAAVAGVSAIVHCAGTKKDDALATKNLLRPARALEKPPHVVAVSVVGADKVPSTFMLTKLEAERLVRDSGLPWTILRATQFYELALTGAKRSARLPLIPAISGFLVQPVDADEVAARLVELVLGEPAGRVPDIGGPQVLSAATLIRDYLRATKRRRLVIPFWMPGLGAIRSGGLLVRKRKDGETETSGKRTWQEFLTARTQNPEEQTAGTG